MDTELPSFDLIQHRASTLAASAMRSDYWLNAQVRGIDRNPLGQPADLLHELYPEADGHLEIAQIPAIVAAEQIAASLEFWDRETDPTSGRTETDIGSISRGFVRLIQTHGARHFEVSDLNCPCDRRSPQQRIHHPFAGYTYWTHWLFTTDPINGRATGLAIGASD